MKAVDRRVQDVLVALRGAFETRGWHGPTVLQSLRGVRAAEAAICPHGAHHTIHELVQHIEYWEGRGIRYVTGSKSPRPLPRDWTPPLGTLADSVASLKATHEVLVEAVRQLRGRDLDRPVKTAASGTMALAEVLHGIAAHDVYHAGQIRLLRTLIRAR